MQVANRTTRRYITPASKNSAGNIRSTAKKSTNPPPISHTSPKKVADTSTSKSNEPSTLKKFVDRFRYDEPQARPERDSINSDFWWLHDELKTTCDTAIDDDDDDERKSNVPEFIEIFPSTDIDQDLNKRASLLLNQTFSAHSSDIGHVSSTGIGSTASTTMTTTTTSTFQPVVHEQSARPIFTRFTDSKYDLKSDNGDDDILYQWRLRRRLEQAQNGEPITFPSKVTNRTNISPAPSFFPSIPVEVPTVLPPPPPVLRAPVSVPLVVISSSPKRERQQSSTINTETESIKPTATTPIPVRHYSEVATQTIQDACIQTSPMTENRLSSLNELDLQPTRDDDNRSSVWHRPPPRSKYEITQVSASPSPIKRHHHSFRPVVIAGQTTTTNNSHQHHHHHHHHRSHIYPSTNLQSSQDSTLTHVTSIMINDNNSQIRHPNNNDIIDESDEQHRQNDNADDHIDYSKDEILNILIQKRDELLIAFRDIEQRLTNMNS